MPFIKGHPKYPPKDKEAFKKKMREISLADGRKPDFTGRHHSEETKEILRVKSIGRHGFWKGKKRPEMKSEKYRKTMSIASKKVVASGKHNFWKGGVTEKNQSERNFLKSQFEYKEWRRKVFERDDYRCFDCGERGGKLEADHIYQWHLYPNLRFEVLNGQTLCINCHRQKTIFERIGKCAIL